MKEAPCIGIVERTEKIQHNGVPVTLDYIRCEETGTSALLQTTTRRLPHCTPGQCLPPVGRVQLNGSKYLSSR